MNVGNNIKILRQNLNMTQQDLADSLGISRSAISRIEKKNFIDTKILDKISKKFNIPITKLIEDNTIVYNNSYSPYQLKTIRDINKNSIEMYRKLSDRHKSFTRALGLEVHKEITHCENRAVENFSKDLIRNMTQFSCNLNKHIQNEYINFIDKYTKQWLSENKPL